MTVTITRLPLLRPDRNVNNLTARRPDLANHQKASRMIRQQQIPANSLQTPLPSSHQLTATNPEKRFFRANTFGTLPMALVRRSGLGLRILSP